MLSYFQSNDGLSSFGYGVTNLLPIEYGGQLETINLKEELTFQPGLNKNRTDGKLFDNSNDECNPGTSLYKNSNFQRDISDAFLIAVIEKGLWNYKIQMYLINYMKVITS